MRVLTLLLIAMMTVTVVVAYAQSTSTISPTSPLNASNVFQFNMNVNVTATPPSNLLPGNIVVNVLATPLNASALNITLVSFYANGTALSSTFNIGLGVVNGNTATLKVMITNVAAAGYYTFIVNGVNSYNVDAVIYNVTVNGVTYPGKGIYFYVLFQLPAVSTPPIIASYLSLIAFAIFVAIAGRYSMRDTGIGLLVFGIVIGPMLMLIGVTSVLLNVLWVVSWVLGILFIVAGHKYEQ